MTAAMLSACAVVALLGATGRPRARPVSPSEVHTAAPVKRRFRHRRWMRWGIGLLVASATVGPVLTAALAIVFAAWPRGRALLMQRAAQRAADAALPDAIEMLILILHAGLTPHQAMVMLETRAPQPTRAAFEEVQHRIRRGAALADALAALPDTLGPGAAPIADVLAITERHGTPISSALEQLAREVRNRRARLAEANARKLPIKMSFPLVVCVLPAFVLVAIVPAVLAALSSLDIDSI